MYTTGRTLPITEEELHYELNDAGVLRVAKVEIERMKAAGTSQWNWREFARRTTEIC